MWHKYLGEQSFVQRPLVVERISEREIGAAKVVRKAWRAHNNHTAFYIIAEFLCEIQPVTLVNVIPIFVTTMQFQSISMDALFFEVKSHPCNKAPGPPSRSCSLKTQIHTSRVQRYLPSDRRPQSTQPEA